MNVTHNWFKHYYNSFYQLYLPYIIIRPITILTFGFCIVRAIVLKIVKGNSLVSMQVLTRRDPVIVVRKNQIMNLKQSLKFLPS